MTEGRPGEPTGVIDLRRLGIASGGAAHADVSVVLQQVVLGGQTYEPRPPVVETVVDVSDAGAGLSMRLQFATRLHGPCQRCLSDAVHDVVVDARDFQTTGRDDVTDPDPDLDCEYLVGPNRQALDVASWAGDCTVEALPMTLLCQGDCRGICPSCGINLNALECDCVDDAIDPRWAALGDLAERLRAQSDDTD